MELFEEIRRGHAAGETIKDLVSQEARSASAHGAAGDPECDSAGEEKGRQGTTETGSGKGLDCKRKSKPC